jgi:hypothetical protein
VLWQLCDCVAGLQLNGAGHICINCVCPISFLSPLQQYGDHLYEEKDFDGSIVQYAHTIGYIPSSTVIT